MEMRLKVVGLLCFGILLADKQGAWGDTLPLQHGAYASTPEHCQPEYRVNTIEIREGTIRQFESSCRIRQVSRTSGNTFRVSATCQGEGNRPALVSFNLRAVTTVSFSLDNIVFRLCTTRSQQVPIAAEVDSKLTWQTGELSNWAKSHLTKLYNREYVSIRDRNINWDDPPFAVATVRLQRNATSNPDLIVRWSDSAFCGSGGCRIEVWLANRDATYTRGLTVIGANIELGDTYHLDFRDLWLDDNRFRWSGVKYDRR